MELHLLDCKTYAFYPVSSIGHSTVDRMQLPSEASHLHCVRLSSVLSQNESWHQRQGCRCERTRRLELPMPKTVIRKGSGRLSQVPTQLSSKHLAKETRLVCAKVGIEIFQRLNLHRAIIQ